MTDDELRKLAEAISALPDPDLRLNQNALAGVIGTMKELARAVLRLLEEREREVGERFLIWRGVEEPCKRCGGVGRCGYANTTTWRGGAGGQMMTDDVCDACWGTGDANRKGVDLRRLASATNH